MKRLLLVTLCLWSTSGCGSSPVCGNGKVENGEDCDGWLNAPTHRTRSCVELGYNDGTAVCTSECRLDFSPCLSAGKCGDGVFDEGHEECDTQLSGRIPCPAPRFSGGFAGCMPGCLLDTSPCEFCGDGVLQPEAGELLEVDFETCSTAGWFGGVATTADCQTASDGFCGPYRLLPYADSLEAPVLRPDGQGGLWLAMVTHGFDEPGCAVESPIIHYEQEPDPDYNNDNFNCKSTIATLVGYQVTGCARLGLARLTLQQRIQWSPTDSLIACRPLDLFVLPDNLGLLCQRDPPSAGSDLFSFQVTDLQGQLQASFPFFSSTAAYLPVAFLRSSQELELWSFQSGVQLSAFRYAVDTGELVLLGAAGLGPESADEVVLPGAAFFADPLSDADRLLQFSQGPAPGAPVLAQATLVAGSITTIAGALLPGAHPVPLERELDWTARELRMAWSSFEADAIATFHVGRWDLDGQVLETRELPLPPFQRVDFAARAPEGGWVVGGVTKLSVPPEGDVGPCEPAPGALRFYFFTGRLSEDGELTELRYFLAPGVSHVTTAQHEGMPAVELGPWYVRDGDVLYAYGLYDRSAHFCTPDEPVRWRHLVPVHAFGVYIVRLELPG